MLFDRCVDLCPFVDVVRLVAHDGDRYVDLKEHSPCVGLAFSREA